MGVNSYSQFGEDRILKGLMAKDGLHIENGGFYLDVGAHHPERFSNTKIFYDLGWSGINIDPNEGIKQKFEESRPRDKTLEIALGKQNGVQEFFNYDESALNSLINRDQELINTQYLPSGSKMVQVSTIKEILNQFHKEDIPNSSFLDIDVEGHELDVLLGNNWDKYKFSYILIEQKLTSLETIQDCLVSKYLGDLSYKPMAHNGITTIFKNFS
jgi:FkbM family methyltransferase